MSKENKALRKKPGVSKLRSFFIDLMVFGLPLPKKYDEVDPVRETAAERRKGSRGGFATGRRLAIACACLLVVVFGAGAWKLLIEPMTVQAETLDVNKLMKTYAHEISAGSMSVNGSENSVVTIELDATVPMETGQKVLPELKVPGYVPEGYVYQGLRISCYPDGSYEARYVFKDQEKELLFQQRFFGKNVGSITSYNLHEEAVSEDGSWYYGTDLLTEINQMLFLRNDGVRFAVLGVEEKVTLKDALDAFKN